MLDYLLKKLYKNMMGADMPEYWTSNGYYNQLIGDPEEVRKGQ